MASWEWPSLQLREVQGRQVRLQETRYFSCSPLQGITSLVPLSLKELYIYV